MSFSNRLDESFNKLFNSAKADAKISKSLFEQLNEADKLDKHNCLEEKKLKILTFDNGEVSVDECNNAQPQTEPLNEADIAEDAKIPTFDTIVKVLKKSLDNDQYKEIMAELLQD